MTALTITRAHFKDQMLQHLRAPGYLIPTLAMPAMFFFLFQGGGESTVGNTFTMASYMMWAILAVAFFQFGVGIASERSTPWEGFLRTLPLPPLLRLAGRLLAAMFFAVVAAAIVVGVSYLTTPISMAADRWLPLAAALLAGGATLAFAGIAVLAGKRIRFGYFLIMVTSITFFNLLTPVGEVLLKAGPLVVTRGALRQGLMKGFAIPGLVFISLFAVRPDLQLPGRLGGLIARLFFYFEQLLDGRKRIRLRRFVDSVDELLMELLQSGPATDVASSPAVRTTRLGYLFVSILATSSIAVVVLFGAF